VNPKKSSSNQARNFVRSKGRKFRMRKFLGVVAFLVSVGLPASANAALQTLSSLFVFGDSLSDGGNSGLVSQAATNGAYTYPPSPYYNGQYSNGPVAVEYLWRSYNGNAPFIPSLAGGTNYAIGGATTGVDNFNAISSTTGALGPAYVQLGNNWQLNTFGAQLAGGRTFDPVSSLFVIWTFPNDVFNWVENGGFTSGTIGGAAGVGPVGVDALIGNGINNIVQTVLALASTGAQHFLIPNMPDLGEVPEFKGTAFEPGMKAVSQGFNFYLAQALTALDAQLASAEIVQFDLFETLNRAAANPGAYGFMNTTEKCIDHILDGRCDPSNNTWLFWDGVHPTTYAHSIIGAEFRAAVPEPETILLLAFGLLGILATRRR